MQWCGYGKTPHPNPWQDAGGIFTRQSVFSRTCPGCVVFRGASPLAGDTAAADYARCLTAQRFGPTSRSEASWSVTVVMPRLIEIMVS